MQIVWSYCISTSNKFNTSKYVHNLVPKGMYFHGKKSLPEFTTGKWLFFYINFYSRFLLWKRLFLIKFDQILIKFWSNSSVTMHWIHFLRNLITLRELMCLCNRSCLSVYLSIYHAVKKKFFFTRSSLKNSHFLFHYSLIV